MTSRTRRSLVRESDLDASIRLRAGVRDSPTPVRPTTPAAAAALGTDTATVRATRAAYERLPRRWPRSTPPVDIENGRRPCVGTSLAGLMSILRRPTPTDIDKLAKLVINVKQEIQSAGLSIDVF
ncbi:hypothetical protein CYMTET_14748 [Cymbomonas tetramitiformis]|uniref:Uncharacterized protein n=1 Tax=Cymbomonas tetramitiformis TaxID=36881 RepID=A0AAE0L9V7_9CHLO|nr:hypothetical protein CYMTET_14748 [Cymbomonas tetramitiformis]